MAFGLKKTAPVLACAAAVLCLLPARPAGASFWQACRITATITSVGEFAGAPELGLKITQADTMGGSNATCDDKQGTEVTALVTDVPKGTSFAEGQSITLDYTFYNGMGEDGVVSDQTWKYLPPEQDGE